VWHRTVREGVLLSFLFDAFVLWNNSGGTNLQRLFHAVFQVLRGPKPQDAGAPSLSSVLTSEQTWDLARVCTNSPTSPKVSTDLGYCNCFYPTIQCNCSACNVPPDAGLQERANFSTLILGLAGTGNQTRATCVAGSSASRSAIHYDFRGRPL
jgi:hypothetical protein